MRWLPLTLPSFLIRRGGVLLRGTNMSILYPKLATSGRRLADYTQHMTIPQQKSGASSLSCCTRCRGRCCSPGLHGVLSRAARGWDPARACPHEGSKADASLARTMALRCRYPFPRGSRGIKGKQVSLITTTLLRFATEGKDGPVSGQQAPRVAWTAPPQEAASSRGLCPQAPRIYRFMAAGTPMPRRRLRCRRPQCGKSQGVWGRDPPGSKNQRSRTVLACRIVVRQRGCAVVPARSGAESRVVVLSYSHRGYRRGGLL